MLPPASRVPQVKALIERKAYFVVHAPRQVGKTTSLLALADELTRDGVHAVLLVSMIVAANRTIRGAADIAAAEDAILESWRTSADLALPEALRPPPWPAAAPGNRIGAALGAWARACPSPLVLFLDEFDALQGELLVSVMRQIQDGYRLRPRAFPWSMGLVGLRDVKDYRFDDAAAVGPGGFESAPASAPSPFNIIVESLTVPMFTLDDVATLYAQHTADTGQVFRPDAIQRAFDLAGGQPWLVNALARQLTDVVVPDRSEPIGAHHVEQAKAILLERRDTHLGALSDKLRDPRVRAVIEPMLAGDVMGEVSPDDRRYVLDLGLVRRTADGGLDVANPIYREIIARTLASGPRDTLPQIAPTWRDPSGRLDRDALLAAFLAFWRRHGEPLLKAAPYSEVAAHLVLMAFLDRVANGGGTLEREYAIGRGRMDLCLRLGPDVLGIEVKVWRDRRPDPKLEGLAQMDGYLAGLGVESGQPPIEERTRVEEGETPGGRRVAVIRA